MTMFNIFRYNLITKVMVRQNSESCVYKNPCERLQEYMQIPLLRENEAPFKPSLEELESAEQIFTPSRNNKILLLTKAVNLQGFPDHDLSEVAFIGRSNVGKSSLLKAILRKVPKLRIGVSSSPGHTRTVNFYTVGSKLGLVDMPGYGYKQPKHFADSVETFLSARKNLQRTFLLMDGEVGFAPWDQVAVEMLEEFQVPYGLIMTKIDKCKDSKLINNLITVQAIRDDKMSTSCFPQPFLVSSLTLEGVAYLQAFISYITGNLVCKNQ